MRPGDLIFYTNSGGTINHVALYIGGGRVCHASNARDGIKISTWNYRTPVSYTHLDVYKRQALKRNSSAL